MQRSPHARGRIGSLVLLAAFLVVLVGLIAPSHDPSPEASIRHRSTRTSAAVSDGGRALLTPPGATGEEIVRAGDRTSWTSSVAGDASIALLAAILAGCVLLFAGSARRRTAFVTGGTSRGPPELLTI